MRHLARNALVACCALFCSCAFQPGLVGATPAPSTSLSMTLRLDSFEYVLGQPVLAWVVIRNDGPERFQDMAYLKPELGYLSFALVKDGKPVRDVGARDAMVFFGEGLLLRSGESVCELINLGDLFGGPGWVTSIVGGGFRSLPTGQYELAATFSARLGLVKGLPPVVIKSGVVRFEVKEDPDTSASEPLLDAIRGAGDRTKAQAIVDEALTRRRGVGPSPAYIALAAQLGLASEARLPSKDLSEGKGMFGLNRIQEVALLKWRYESVGAGSAPRRSWIKSITGRRNTPEVACLLHSLERIIDERAKYRRD